MGGSSGANLICNMIYFSLGNSGTLAEKQSFSRLLRLFRRGCCPSFYVLTCALGRYSNPR